MDEFEAQSHRLRKDLENRTLGDLNGLDPEELRQRVVRLVQEMQDNTKWETLRFYEAQKKLEDGLAAEYKKNLRSQSEKYEELNARELRMREDQLEREYSGKMQELQSAADGKTSAELQQQQEQLTNELQAELQNQKESIAAEWNDKMKAELAQASALQEAERSERLEEVQGMRMALKAFRSTIDDNSSFDAFNSQTHKVSAAVLALANRSEENVPLTAELAALRQAGAGDDLISSALDSIPPKVVKSGSQTVSQLIKRFSVVRKAAHVASLVPEKSPTVLGHGFAHVFSFFYFEPPAQLIEGDDIDAVFARAAHMLEERGDLDAAVKELRQVKGLAGDAVSDWLKDADGRLRLNLAIEAAKSWSALLSASLH